MTGPLIPGDKPLTPSDVVAVARGRQVVLGEAAVARMKASSAVLDSILARGEEVSGLTNGVGAIKTVRVTADQQQAFQILLPGWPTPRFVVRSLSPARDRPATVTLTNWTDGSAATPRREP